MLLAVDKPTGMTSFGVIARIRRHFPKGTKVGHAGTLDPLATGLMLIGTHHNTKTLTGLTKLDKTYEVAIDLSQRSDTRDTEYREHIEHVSDLERNNSLLDPKHKSPQEQEKLIENTLKVLIPSHTLLLPHFSAKKKNGQKMYDLARKGKYNDEFREMRIYSIEIISRESPVIKLRISVGSGTYIRSIAYRLGQQLKTGGGIVTQLRRTEVDQWSLEELEKQDQHELSGLTGIRVWEMGEREESGKKE